MHISNSAVEPRKYKYHHIFIRISFKGGALAALFLERERGRRMAEDDAEGHTNVHMCTYAIQRLTGAQQVVHVLE